MEVTIRETNFRKISLSDNEVTEITKNKLKELVYPGEYLRFEKGKTVVKQNDPHHQHGSIDEDYVRDATDLDIAVFAMLEYL
jgi:hypothetical protein